MKYETLSDNEEIKKIIFDLVEKALRENHSSFEK